MQTAFIIYVTRVCKSSESDAASCFVDKAHLNVVYFAHNPSRQMPEIMKFI